MASLRYQNASSSSLASRCKYDVFLSFRGEDTRKNFVGHLYKALDQKGIHTFKDDPKLQRGKAISPELFKAIEDSRFSIIVFSEDYASSTWCLEELVKILECMDTMGQIVLPVFCKVNPSHVRKQAERFAEVFAKHEEDCKAEMEKVHRWRSALTRAANLSGWDSQDRDESMLIEEIVRHIFEKLMRLSSSERKGLVGMNSRINDINSLLHIGLDDVRIIGIWGMGGIGKTTISRAIYDQISFNFEGCCFLANVKEGWRHGPARLLEELLSKILMQKNEYMITLDGGFNVTEERLRYKKVFIVLDDVDKLDQLEILAGDKSWFGPGSRIIITTRDKHLLIAHGVTKIYEARLLHDDQSLQLFLKYAFKQNQPTEDFMDLSKRVVNYAQGLPLALKVLGSFLFSRSIAEWIDGLKKLERIPDAEIQNVLKISFDGLDDRQKDIFLDIACFFEGKDKDYVAKLLDSCGFFPCIGIRVLVDRALITISDNKLQMHDLLQEMGWEIVRQESVKEPGERSRLWICEEVNHVLMQNMATRAVEGIILDLFDSEDVHLNTEAFARMNKLRLLKVYYSHLSRDFEYSSEEVFCGRTTAYGRMNTIQPPKTCKLHLSGDFKFLSHELRCLCWHQYPLKSLPFNFHPKNLLELDMRYSHIQQLWKGIKPLFKLEFIDLSHSQYLTETPDFTGVPNLKRLILEGCKRLSKVHSSIGFLNNLIFLNLKDCTSLTSLPRSIYLKSLKTLTLSGCSRLQKFPEISGNMEYLSELLLDGTAIEELSPSINRLTGLVLLNLKDCRRFKSLPNSICQLKSLAILNLSGCSKLESFPEILENMKGLKKLLLDGTAIKELDSSIEHLNGLVLLNLENCRRLESLPSSICQLKSLEILVLSGCSKLESFPDIWENMKGLKNLLLDGTALKDVDSSIELLDGLILLNLENCKDLASLPNSICNLKSLEILILSGCSKLDELPENLGNLKSLAELKVDGLALEKFPSSILSLNNLRVLSARGCKNTLSQSLVLPASSGLCSLTDLDLRNCNILEIPTGICCLSSLQKLDLSENNFRFLPESIRQLSQLRYLHLVCCRRLQSVPELPARVWFMDAHDCASLEAVSIGGTASGPVYRNFIFTNCFKLASSHVSNIMAVSIQQAHCLPLSTGYAMFLPGCEIPMWFSHQRTGSSITIQLPPDWLDGKFMGFAVCAVYTFEDANDERCPLATCNCTFKSSYDEENFSYYFVDDWERQSGGRFIGSDHLFLGHAPLHDMLDDIYGEDKHDRLLRSGHLFLHDEDKFDDFHERVVSYTEASFEFCVLDDFEDLIPYRVKKCGVCLVYNRDKRENNLTMIEPSHRESFSVIHQDFGQTLKNEGTKTERGHNGYNYRDEDVGSGSGSFDKEEEEPHPKRLKETKFF